MGSELFQYSAEAQRSHAEQAIRSKREGRFRQIMRTLGSAGRELLRILGGREPSEAQVQQLLREAEMPAGRQQVPQAIRPRTISRREPPGPEELGMSEEYFTPSSSNVYSFQYDFASSTLYVTFKDGELVAGRARVASNPSGLLQIVASRGAMSGNRPNRPGPRYAYINVPVSVFRLVIGAGSAGGAVWDRLRVRGSRDAHQYDYFLVSPGVTPLGGQMAPYVPRRVTPAGYETRQVRVAGGGRTLQSSMAPTGAPDRGIPDRAEPDRGTA